MKNNNIEKQQDIIFIESTKGKYFFIGFIIALIPYIFIGIILKNLYSSDLYNYTFIIAAIITAIINGLVMNYKAIKKLNILFLEKYEK